jgi:hypothetical protein
MGTITETDFGYSGQRNLDAQGNSDRLGLMDYKARIGTGQVHLGRYDHAGRAGGAE